jgi:hypothetical protein
MVFVALYIRAHWAMTGLQTLQNRPWPFEAQAVSGALDGYSNQGM